jgi:hypothetical protein
MSSDQYMQFYVTNLQLWTLLISFRLEEHWKNMQWLQICSIHISKTGKAIPVTGHGGPYGCGTSRLPHFLDNWLTHGSEVVSLTRQPPFTPKEDSWYSFLSVQLERLGKLRESNGIGIPTCNLQACSIVPQPTTKSPPQFISVMSFVC